jgi:glyoxylase-like metal-dependent hydrolase (beta-lactamase superfamily II)
MRHSPTPVAGKRPALTRNVAPGIHRLAHAYVNCYLVEEGSAITIVDTALPATWPHLLFALKELGHTRADIEAIVVTHAHFDHLGFAARAVRQLSVPIWVHENDHYIAAHPYRYAHERSRLAYPLLYPAAIPLLGAMAAAGALWVRGVKQPASVPSSGSLDVPGRPEVIFSPGHTFGHCGLHFADRDAITTGDAVVTLDPYKGETGPQIIAGAATADSAMALTSLAALAQTDAGMVLPGHGEPFAGGIRTAVTLALAAGAS